MQGGRLPGDGALPGRAGQAGGGHDREQHAQQGEGGAEAAAEGQVREQTTHEGGLHCEETRVVPSPSATVPPTMTSFRRLVVTEGHRARAVAQADWSCTTSRIRWETTVVMPSPRMVTP